MLIKWYKLQLIPGAISRGQWQRQNAAKCAIIYGVQPAISCPRASVRHGSGKRPTHHVTKKNVIDRMLEDRIP